MLSSSDTFVRTGPPRSCMWGLRPSNPLFLSDGALLSSVTQVLAQNGPLVASDIVEKGDISGATPKIISDFLFQHKTEFVNLPNQQWWFAGQPIPERWSFENVVLSLIHALNTIGKSATIEELHWLLCLSTVNGCKKISRRKISRELSRRTDLFQHISRAKYALIPQYDITPVSCASLAQSPASASINNSISINQWNCFDCNCKQDKNIYELLTPCQTPPPNTSDFFDPNEFFSIGFSGSFECP